MPMRPVLLAGLTAMGAVALLSAIWPAVAGVVAGVFVSALAATALVPTVLALRWVRRELTWRRELRTMPAAAATVSGVASVEPTLAELRESA